MPSKEKTIKGSYRAQENLNLAILHPHAGDEPNDP
jgi:hypothetical protein